MGISKVLHPPRPERKILEALTVSSIGLLAKLNFADVHVFGKHPTNPL